MAISKAITIDLRLAVVQPDTALIEGMYMSKPGWDWPIVGLMSDYNPRRFSKVTAACSKLRARIMRKQKRIAVANDRLEDHADYIKLEIV